MATTHHHGLPSPMPSAGSPASTSNGSTMDAMSLPNQRGRPLQPGSPKEIALIHYIDVKVRYITRRYATKYTNIKTKANEAPGYTDFEQFVADLDPLIDLVWVTGTPTLQIPYMLTFAGMVASYMPAFPFRRRAFQLLKRLDTGFSLLLRGPDSAPSLVRHTVSTTEKVRIRSLVEETRRIAVLQASPADYPLASEDTSDLDDDDDDDDNDDDEDSDEAATSNEDANDEPIALGLAKVYEKTMAILGDSLAAPVTPVLADDSLMDLS